MYFGVVFGCLCVFEGISLIFAGFVLFRWFLFYTVFACCCLCAFFGCFVLMFWFCNCLLLRLFAYMLACLI